MHNLTTYLRRVSQHLLLIFLLLNSLIAAADSSLQQSSTGWLMDFKHPAVSVQMQLTGETDPLLKTVNALLQIELQADWKTYWRSPGEGGAAPHLDFSQSHNITDIVWSWPAPTRYNVFGVDTLGYKEMVTFPITLYLDDLSKATLVDARLTVSSCTTICVQNDYPIKLQFDSAHLVVNDEASFLYRQALAQVPIKLNPLANNQQLPMSVLSSAWDNTAQTLSVTIDNKTGWHAPDIFIDSADDTLSNVTFSAPKITITGNTLSAQITASRWGETINLDKYPLNLTVTDDGLAIELLTIPGESYQSGEPGTLFSMFFIALMGGLILNIMPCVLPVLGMKLSAILAAQGINRSQVRKQFIASSMGILSSFWLLAAFLLILKLYGQAIGWGIQFQSPYFIALMVLITALFSANMLDIFTLQLPSNTQTWLATKGAQSYLGHFLQGMFATLLATPCSAPFLGTAVAFSLAASSLQLFIIFSALGLGMALPWLLIALFPSLALWLPKPGRWMNSLKIFFALMMLVTSYWLLSLLTSFIGLILTLYLGLLITIFFLYLLARKGQKKLFIIVLITILLTAISGVTVNYLFNENTGDAQTSKLQWQPLDSVAIARQVQQGKVVFVDITAAWCVTCKANKIGVILQDPVYTRLQQPDIVAMQGDWTTASERVTEYLQSHGRVAVPFNIVYGPSAPQGIPLQTILTTDVVVTAIEQAKGKSTK